MGKPADGSQLRRKRGRSVKTDDLLQALLRVLVGYLLLRRGRLHGAIERREWVWDDTMELSGRLEAIDQALTQVGWFDTSCGGNEP